MRTSITHSLHLTHILHTSSRFSIFFAKTVSIFFSLFFYNKSFDTNSLEKCYDNCAIVLFVNIFMKYCIVKYKLDERGGKKK